MMKIKLFAIPLSFALAAIIWATLAWNYSNENCSMGLKSYLFPGILVFQAADQFGFNPCPEVNKKLDLFGSAIYRGLWGFIYSNIFWIGVVPTLLFVFSFYKKRRSNKNHNA